MRKLFLLTIFIVITPIFILTNLYLLFHLKQDQTQSISKSYEKIEEPAIAYAALPTAQGIFSSQVHVEDVRVDSVRSFFSTYNSPLEPFAEQVVSAADKYNIDHRLIPAIAMQESNLCKKIPNNSFNCWGFGIYGSKVTKFNNYEEAINTVTKTLSKNYIEKGLITPLEIMKKYTPSNNGGWAKAVVEFMNKI